jgi:hypothetical protein
MRGKKILGIVLVIVGIGLFGFSLYLKQQIESGQIQVSDAQSRLDFGKKLLPSDPLSKGAGNVASSPFQSKIDAAVQQIKTYGSLATGTKLAGFVLILTGGAILLVSRKKFQL